MQRIGVCQALLHEPELLILDEPFSGLDPIGRKDIRDILLEQREQGKTLLFTSHVLSDVEMLCNRVGIIKQGIMTAYGSLAELLRPEVRRVEIEIAGVNAEQRKVLEAASVSVRDLHERVVVTVEGDEQVPRILKIALDANAHVMAVIPHRETLEDLFIREAMTDETPRTPEA